MLLAALVMGRGFAISLMVDLNPNSARDLSAGRDFLEFMAGAPDWETLVSRRAGDLAQGPDGNSTYPLLWAGSDPSLHASASQFLRHVCIEADPVLTRYWLLRQFQEQAYRKNHGVFFIPERDVEVSALVSGAQHLQVHGSTRTKGRRFNLLAGLTASEAAHVLLAVMPPAEKGGSDYLRESGLFTLLLVFKAMQATGEPFSLDRVVQLLTQVDALRELAANSSNSGYSGLSQYLSSFPADPAARLNAQVGELAVRLFALGHHLHYGQWFQTKGEPLAPYLSSSLTSVCMGPDKLGDGLSDLQRIWLEFVGVLMVRRQTSAAKQPFICGWPMAARHVQAALTRLLPVTQGTGNVFLFGVEAARPSPFGHREESPLKPLAATRLTKRASDDWDISQTV